MNIQYFGCVRQQAVHLMTSLYKFGKESIGSIQVFH